MLYWNPERVIFAHGRWYDTDGAAALKRAFRWLLGYQFLMFGGLFATHGVNSAFLIEITAIQTDSQAVDSAIVLLLLRDMGRVIGRMLT